MTRRGSLKPLLLILALAVIVRMIYLWQFQQLPLWEHLTVDNNYHLHWAENIANGNLLGDTTYFRAPLYIFVLAGLMKVFGVSLWVFRLFGLVVGLVTIVFVYKTANRLAGSRAGQLAALLAAVYPMGIFFESELLLDAFFTMLFVAAFYSSLVASEKKKASLMFACGLLWGLAAIARPTALVILPVVFWLSIRDPEASFRTGLRRGGALVLGVGLIVLLTSGRNLYVADDPVVIASQGGINLYIGNNPIADGVTAKLEEPLGQNWRISDITYVAEKDLGEALKPGEVSSYWTGRALAWIVSNPGMAAKLYLKKLAYFFSNREVSNNRDLDRHFKNFPILWYNPLTFGLLLILASCGVVLNRKSIPNLKPVAALVVLYALAVSLFFFSSRFRLPIMPFLIISASTLAVIKKDDLRRRRSNLVIAALISGAIAFLIPVKYPAGTPVMDAISRGLFYYHRGDFRQALDIFQSGRAIDSTFPEINLNCGAAELRLGQTDSARNYFDREVVANPMRQASYTNLASIALLRGQTDKAGYDIRQALTLKPYDINSNILMIRILGKDMTVKEPEFENRADSAVNQTDSDIEVLLEAGIASIDRGFYDAAERYLLGAKLASPPPIETDDYAFDSDFRNNHAHYRHFRSRVEYQLGYLYALQAMYPESVQASARAVELDGNLVEAYVNLIAGHIMLGQKAQADSLLDLARTKFPNSHLFDRFRGF